MGTISLLTHSFLDGYNRDFGRVFGGGLERYMADLCEVISEMGERPEIHQLSFFEPFETEWQGIPVHGHLYDISKATEGFEEMANEAPGHLVYGSFIWHPIRYKPGSLGICHGINWDDPRLPRDAKAGVADAIQSALDQLSSVVSVDSHFQTYCRAVCRFDRPERIRVIPNAVDTSFFSPGPDRKTTSSAGAPLRVLYPRRISIERGIVPMMRLADALLERYPGIEVEFAGDIVRDSHVGDAFETWLEDHPRRESIVHRTYDFQGIRDAYRSADIAVVPTIFSEGTSYSCLEAMSCGLPVVATNVGGLNDLIIDRHNGLLVPPATEPLLQAVSALVEDRAMRDSLGENARKSALAFDKAIWKKRWAGVLEAYLSRQ